MPPISPEEIALIQIDTWEDYMPQAARTAGAEHHHLEHYVLGLGTEAGELLDAFKKHKVYSKELDFANLIEEIGDLSWYAVNLYRLWDVEYTPLKVMETHDDIYRHSLSIHHLSGLLVSDLEYYLSMDMSTHLSGEECEDEVEQFVQNLLFHCGEMLTLMDSNWQVCWTKNIQKLCTRYPEKFTEARALKRDLVAERKILEG